MKEQTRAIDKPMAKAIRALRFDLKNMRFKKTQGEVAESAGIPLYLLWAWEHGKSKPDETQLRALLKAYRVTKGDFEQLVIDMGDTGQPALGAEATTQSG